MTRKQAAGRTVREDPILSAYAKAEVERLLTRTAFEVRNVIAQATPDSVHDLRVSIRRFSQGLRIFDVVFPKGAAKKVRRRIRDIRDEAAFVRDTDVMMDLLREKGLPPEHPLLAKMQAERASMQKLLQENLQKLTEAEYSAEWRRILELDTP